MEINESFVLPPKEIDEAELNREALAEYEKTKKTIVQKAPKITVKEPTFENAEEAKGDSAAAPELVPENVPAEPAEAKPKMKAEEKKPQPLVAEKSSCCSVL